MITEEEIDLIRKKADIVDIVSSYIPVIQKGKNHFSVCPFHDDHNPSMVVSNEKQIFNCFTCHTGGNVFTFVMKYENVSFPEAVKIVANKVGVSIDYSSIKNTDKYEKDYEVMNLAKKLYINNIYTKDGLIAKKYLNDRGITDEVINDFGIGLSTNDKDKLYEFFKKQNIEQSSLENLGLITKNGIDIYDFFRNRITIPIENISGHVVGFTGRIYQNEDTAKYVNSRENHIFKKGNILFNYHNAKNYFREAKKIILVEGNMDAIKMHASGIKNVVALMGTSLTNEQVKTLKKNNLPILLLFDNDNAGLNATIKNGDILLNGGLNVEVVRLSDAKDPDEYIEKFGVKALLNNLNSPIKYIDFKIDSLKKIYNLKSAEDLAKFLKEVLEVLKNVDEMTKKVVLNQISLEHNINLDFLEDKPKPKTTVEYIVPIVKKEKVSRYQKVTSAIFYYIISDYKYLKIYKNDLNFFKEKEDRELFYKIDEYYKKNESGILADFITYINHDEMANSKVLNIIEDNENEELSHQTFVGYIGQMKKILKEEEIDEIKKEIKNELDVDKKIKLIDKLTKLKKGSVDYE